MRGSINQIFLKIVAANLMVVGLFAVVVPLVAIYQKKYHDQRQLYWLCLYFIGGVVLVVVGVLMY
jgi:uncharacterized membrane protein YhaH (DUF805 family)